MSARAFQKATRYQAVTRFYHCVCRPQVSTARSSLRCINVPNLTPRRGAKKVTMARVKSLPQGELPPLPPDEDHGLPKAYPRTMQDHRNNMLKFHDCVVLTRVGDFYELYFEHVEEYAPLLNLKQAKKWTSNGDVPMAGFQYTSLDRFLKILVLDLGKKVAISEQIKLTEHERSGTSNLYGRRVTRVVTAGTLIDESFVNPYENNYLLAVHFDGPIPSMLGGLVDRDSLPLSLRAAKVGLSWVDLSSGDFFTQCGDLASLPSLVARVGPQEIVLDPALEPLGLASIQKLLGDGVHSIQFHTAKLGYKYIDDWTTMLEKAVPEDLQKSFSEQELHAGSLVLDYVSGHLLGNKILLQPPIRRSDDEYMSIDKQSLRGLEVRSTLRDGLLQGSLLHALRHTVTKSGARLLSRRLVSPSMSLSVINERLDLVQTLCNNDALREDIRALLSATSDTLRLLQRFAIGRGDADDLLGLARTIDVTSDLSTLLKARIGLSRETSDTADSTEVQTRCLQIVVDSLDLEGPTSVSRAIENAIDEERLSKRHAVEIEQQAAAESMTEEAVAADTAGEESPKLARRAGRAKASSSTAAAFGADDIWIMRSNTSRTLADAHKSLAELLDSAQSLEERLRSQPGCSSLSLKWTASVGHFCHIKTPSGSKSMQAFEGARALTSKKTSSTFSFPEWTDLGKRIDSSKLRIRAEEERVLNKLRAQVIENIMKLRRNAIVLDQLDVAYSSAKIAKERDLIRPILNTGTSHNIIGGRHPTVDVGLRSQGRQFTANNCTVGDLERMYFITGPNMAGKSTYLRQNALITIIAQTGMFVPADYAEIGLVDKVFSRVGSADNLYQDQSTFMVEMLETAEILKQATPRSFVIMDEVGRGTTPEDGVAVGFACLHHLLHVNQCRTLFATHFHRLADMTQDFTGMGYYCTDVVDVGEEGGWAYQHRLKQGVNRQSHALKVARLAGMPQSAIEVAAGVLSDLAAEGRRN